MTMSDMIAIMNQGKIEQIGTPREIYETPRTLFVAKFVGDCNVIQGHVTECMEGLVKIQDDALRTFISSNDAVGLECLKGARCSIVIRPEDIKVGPRSGDYPNRLSGTVVDKLYTGVVNRLMVDVDGLQMVVDADKGEDLAAKDFTELGWDPAASIIILGA